MTSDQSNGMHGPIHVLDGERDNNCPTCGQPIPTAMPIRLDPDGFFRTMAGELFTGQAWNYSKLWYGKPKDDSR